MLISNLQLVAEGARTELSAELPKLAEHGPVPTALEYLWVERGAALSRRTLIYLLHRMYGADEVTLRQQLERLINMCAKFAEPCPGPADPRRDDDCPLT